jgi:membrane-bound lytic murein transglycosylase D
MLNGLFTRRHPLRGLGLLQRLLFAVLLLSLTTPSYAGWWGNLFGKNTTPPAATTDAASAAKQEPVSTTQAASPAPAVQKTTPALDATTLGNNGDDADSDDADTSDADTALLPNVEESVIGDAETPDISLDSADLAEKGDLWQRIRDGFQLDVSIDNDRVAVQRNWYLQHPDYLNRVALRSTRYLHYTVTEAEKRGLPTELALLPIIESAYDPFAYSHANAAGMWQFIPGTAHDMGVKQNYWFDGRRDVIESTRAAYDFLSSLYAKFGDWQLVLAAYNAGPGAVQRAVDRNVANGLPTDFWSLRLPAETQAYVPRFIAIAQIVKAPETYGVSLRPVVDKPFFRTITTHNQVDMTAAAHIAGVSLKEMYLLNAGFNRWATDAEGPYRLLVPASLPADFEAQIAALPTPESVVGKTYRVKKGDTLTRVAKHFGVAATEIKNLNKLTSNHLPVGRTLTITTSNVSPEYTALNREMRLVHAEITKRSASYKVRRGDTLASVARHHGVSTANLARWNGLRSHSRIHAGQRLTLHVSKSSHRRVASAGKKGSRSALQRIHYRVKKGDTLASIGRRYNISVTQIKHWNKRLPSIHAGQGLVLFIADNGQNRNM